RAEGRIGGRRKKLDTAKRREIAESVITGRKSGAEMARLYNISQPTVSRIVAQHRMGSPKFRALLEHRPGLPNSPQRRRVEGHPTAHSDHVDGLRTRRSAAVVYLCRLCQ